MTTQCDKEQFTFTRRDNRFWVGFIEADGHFSDIAQVKKFDYPIGQYWANRLTAALNHTAKSDPGKQAMRQALDIIAHVEAPHTATSAGPVEALRKVRRIAKHALATGDET